MLTEEKRQQKMNNVITNIKPNISIEAAAHFSASSIASGIIPVTALVINYVPDGVLTISVSMECKAGNITVFRCRDKVFDGVSTDAYNYYGGDNVTIRFDRADFEYDEIFLASIKQCSDAEITVHAKIGTIKAEASTVIRICAADEWDGVDAHPEKLASFIDPCSDHIEDIVTESFNEWQISEDKALEYIRSIVKNIRAKNIICSKKESYGLDKRQTVKAPGKLLEMSSVISTPIELAVLFCSCAERAGLDPVIIFSRAVNGIAGVYCGIWINKQFDTVLSESLSMLRGAIAGKEILVFDPVIASSAQNVDIELAADTASEFFMRASTELLFVLDVKNARKHGIYPMSGRIADASTDISPDDRKNARSIMADIYSGLLEKPVFKLLHGEYGAYEYLPLISEDILSVINSARENRVAFKPLEISEKIGKFAGLTDNFCSFALKDEKVVSYNKSEKDEVMKALSGFKSRIALSKAVNTGVYESSFHKSASKMAFSKDDNAYLAVGFLRIYEGAENTPRFFPLCFLKVCVDSRYGYGFRIESERPVINTLLVSYLVRHDVNTSDIESIPRVFELFEKLASSASKNDDEDIFKSSEIIREAALIYADLSDFLLWDELRRSAKVMLRSEQFRKLLSPERNMRIDAYDDDYVFPLYMPDSSNRALLYDGNVIVKGISGAEKLDLIANKVSYNLSGGKRTLIASQSKEFSDASLARISDAGMANASLVISEDTTVSEVIENIEKKCEELKELSSDSASPISKELADVSDKLMTYERNLTKQDPLLGISVLEAIESYASAGEGISDIPELEIDEEAFSGITQEKFYSYFRTAEKLISVAKEALETAGLPRSAPLSLHPLYLVRPSGELDKEFVLTVIDRILPVLSEYREVFFEESRELGMDITDIKDITAAGALNELYRHIISSRDVEIPFDVSAMDISSFASDTDRISKTKARMENIEYQLRFLNKELFDDIDIILPGYNYSSDGTDTNFLKKFILRKNNKDVLLQYVSSENRSEFYQRDTEDIFKLLDEYLRLKKSIGDSSASLTTDENAVRIARLISDIKEQLLKIYPSYTGDDTFIDRKAGRILGYIRKISSDPAVSKKLTVARARFAEVYSDNECLLERLSSHIGASFSSLRFENGLLNYDGLSLYLRKLAENLPFTSEWEKWLEAEKQATPAIASFARYICEKGAGNDVDKLFAKSLIKPAIKYLTDKYELSGDIGPIERAKAKYPSLLNRAREISANNAKIAYEQRLKHYAETENISAMLEDRDISLAAFVNKYADIITHFYPCVFVKNKEVTKYFGIDAKFDTVIFDDYAGSGMLNMPLAALTDNLIALSFTEKQSEFADTLSYAGALICNVSYGASKSNQMMSSFFGKNSVCCSRTDNKVVQIASVNGSMRRSTDMANPKEADTCVAKAFELLSKGLGKVGIFAFTSGQYAYIRHSMSILAEKNDEARDMMASGAIKVYDASVPCFDKLDGAVISFGAAPDKNSVVGPNCGFGASGASYGSLANIGNILCDNLIFVTSLGMKELSKYRRISFDFEKMYYLFLFALYGALPLSKNTEYGILQKKLLEQYENYVYSCGKYESRFTVCDRETSKFVSLDCLDADDTILGTLASSSIADEDVTFEHVSPLKLI